MSTPQLQIALDTTDLPSALGPLQKAADYIDIIECGTILVLCEGFHAVRNIRALFPDKKILADVRIAEAGRKISTLAFEAGADLVSVVAGASLTTVEQVCQVAANYGGEVQIELGETWTLDQAKAWRDAGAQHVIVHRSRDAEASGTLTWTPADLEAIGTLAGLGFTVTVTGGVTASELPIFDGQPVGIIIAGRAIVDAADPATAAEELRESIKQVWS